MKECDECGRESYVTVGRRVKLCHGCAYTFLHGPRPIAAPVIPPVQPSTGGNLQWRP